MGICECDCFKSSQQLQYITKQISRNTSFNLNQIQLSFTNRPLHLLKGQCLIFLANKSNQLYKSQLFNHFDMKIKKKLFEYMELSQKFIMQRNLQHCIMKIKIPKFCYQYLLFFKLQPWDGHHPEEIQDKLMKIVDKCFKTLTRKKIKIFTISEIDQFIGIPSSISCHIYSNILKMYCQSIQKVTFMCKDLQSVDFYQKNIKQLQESQTINTLMKQSQNKQQNNISSQSQDDSSNYF